MVTKLSEVFSIETEQKHIDIPGRTTMDKLCYALTMRQKNDRDNWILITGDLGSGKSTLSIELLRKLSKYNNFKWSLKKNVLFNPDYDEINDKIHLMEQKSTILTDEAAKILHARNWNTADQIQFSIMSDRVRYRRLNILFNIRMMKEVDLLFRVGRFFYWIPVLERGVAAVMARTAGYDLKGKGDAYNTEEIFRRLENLDDNDISSKMAVFESMPNFRGFLYFPPLNSKIDNAYRIMKENSDNQQYQQSKEVELTRQQKEGMLTNLILRLFEKGSTLKEIAEIINKGNPEKPITEYKIKRIISKARRSAEGSVVDKELLKDDSTKTQSQADRKL